MDKVMHRNVVSKPKAQSYALLPKHQMLREREEGLCKHRKPISKALIAQIRIQCMLIMY